MFRARNFRPQALMESADLLTIQLTDGQSLTAVKKHLTMFKKETSLLPFKVLLLQSALASLLDSVFSVGKLARHKVSVTGPLNEETNFNDEIYIKIDKNK